MLKMNRYNSRWVLLEGLHLGRVCDRARDSHAEIIKVQSKISNDRLPRRQPWLLRRRARVSGPCELANLVQKLAISVAGASSPPPTSSKLKGRRRFVRAVGWRTNSKQAAPSCWLLYEQASERAT